jgi:hypothetical protein
MIPDGGGTTNHKGARTSLSTLSVLPAVDQR